ncbi:hypothetical protein PAXRUDRAFT_833910 [Paxillus rubicundulus Ve08.2h10]|uniref:Integral membrane bound transporter domain-containing protein n=1 Tax=Paxillus rubicundulus Ve08.2h10 TaxID=930991 RepID=A0A0D0CWA7_9AGAM|nr:hypothetical protein PAXRUDRAFT_833910 [Paxillus rubicundulus Ve08.2h10]
MPRPFHDFFGFFFLHVTPSRRALARILSTFLCVLLVIIRPFSRLGGSNAFLVLSLKELVFSVQGDLAQQIEITILNVTGALLGIGVSTSAKYFATLPPFGSLMSRLIPALFLATIAFFAGWAKSRLPRLHLSARISCFVSIWLLTENIGIPSRVLPDAGEFLWVTLTAAIVCLFSSMLILHWSSTHFVKEISATLHSLRQCLAISMDGAFAPISSKQVDELEALHMDILRRSVLLNELHSQASFELRFGRVAVEHINPVLGIIEHLRRELSWGMSSHGSTRSGSPQEAERASSPPFQTSALELGRGILASLQAVENLLLVAYTCVSLSPRSVQSERDTVISAAISLNFAWYTTQEDLRSVIRQASENGSHIPPEIHHHCLFATSLLQMAYDTSHILQVAQKIAAHHNASHIRLFYPRLSIQWLGVSPRTFAMEANGTSAVSEPLESTSALSTHEFKQCLVAVAESSTAAETEPMVYFPAFNSASSPAPSPSIRALPQYAFALLVRLWNHPQTLRFRLAASRVIRKTHHSSHLRHAIKNAIGVAVLSVPAYLPADSDAHSWFTGFHGQWIIISFVWVLETNTGATWRIGYLRLSGTILGAIYSHITVLACGRNPYGLVVMVTAFDILVSWVIIKSNVPSLGVVASITLPPVVLTHYLSDRTPQSILDLSLIRAMTIAIGIVSALAMNGLVFPRHSRVIFLNQTSRSLGFLSHLYLLLGRDMFHNIYAFTPCDKRKTVKLELHIRNALQRSKSLLTTMNDELSLVPKPMRHYREVVQKIQKILDLMTGLRKIRENIPRKETVACVLKERREFVSCVSLILFASEQVFRARQPLPQFLPSARQALEVLTTQIELHLWQAIQEDKSIMQLSLVYSLAEREVMKDMVDTLEGLLESCRALFGTSAWLTRTWPELNGADNNPTSLATPGDIWYSALERV